MRCVVVLALLARTAHAGVEIAGDAWSGPFATPEQSLARGTHAERLTRDMPDLEDGGPITEIAALRVTTPDTDEWRVALRVTGAEWYVSPVLGRSTPGEAYCGVEDLQRVGPRLALRVRCLAGRGAWTEETSLVYCGVDRRHRIACGRATLAARFAEEPTQETAKDVVHDTLACKLGAFHGDAVSVLDDKPVVHGDEPTHVLTALAPCPSTLVFHLDGERGLHRVE